ncbi:MAG: hypothetical protein FGF48_07330 [Candidatus Brockarchaeota archaeon]|nr:hypothetical protein [Candidatus Brockarchaeota archaeon]
MKSRWPLIGVKPTSNPYFKIEGKAHYMYVDIPNQLISYFLVNLYRLSEEYKTDLETLYRESKKLENEFNEFFKRKFGGWLSILIKREPFSKRPFGIQIRIDWSSFQSFLEKFAEREDITLEEKYEYLFMCRSEIAWLPSGPEKEFMEKCVRHFSKSLIKEISSTLISFTRELLEKKKKYRERLLLKRKFAPLTLAYLSEIISTIIVINDCVHRGIVSTCYREMRKILENISWVIIDDLLLLRGRKEVLEKIIPPLRIPNKEWYEWAKNKRLIITGLNEFTKYFQVIIEKIMKKYGIGRSEIESSLFNNMTYPLFLFLSGSREMPPPSLKDIVYETEAIKPFVKENIKMIIASLLKRSLSSSDEEFINELSDLLAVGKHISIRYPSNKFIMQLVEKISSIKIDELYKRYSYFVHSYDKAWQFYPFSSILEFKIFKHEMVQFIRLVTQLLDFYEKVVYSRSKRKSIS